MATRSAPIIRARSRGLRRASRSRADMETRTGGGAALPALQGYVVEVACWVRVLEVDGRGQDLVAQGERAGDRLEGPGGAEQVAGHGLGGGDGQLVGVGAEGLADGLGLGRVAQRRAGA